MAGDDAACIDMRERGVILVVSARNTLAPLEDIKAARARRTYIQGFDASKELLERLLGSSIGRRKLR